MYFPMCEDAGSVVGQIIWETLAKKSDGQFPTAFGRRHNARRMALRRVSHQVGHELLYWQLLRAIFGCSEIGLEAWESNESKIWIDMGVSIVMGVPQNRYKGKSYENGWFRGTPILGTSHICGWVSSLLGFRLRSASIPRDPNGFISSTHDFGCEAQLCPWLLCHFQRPPAALGFCSLVYSFPPTEGKLIRRLPPFEKSLKTVGFVNATKASSSCHTGDWIWTFSTYRMNISELL